MAQPQNIALNYIFMSKYSFDAKNTIGQDGTTSTYWPTIEDLITDNNYKSLLYKGLRTIDIGTGRMYKIKDHPTNTWGYEYDDNKKIHYQETNDEPDDNIGYDGDVLITGLGKLFFKVSGAWVDKATFGIANTGVLTISPNSSAQGKIMVSGTEQDVILQVNPDLILDSLEVYNDIETNTLKSLGDVTVEGGEVNINSAATKFKFYDLFEVDKTEIKNKLDINIWKDGTPDVASGIISNEGVFTGKTFMIKGSGPAQDDPECLLDAGGIETSQRITAGKYARSGQKTHTNNNIVINISDGNTHFRNLTTAGTVNISLHSNNDSSNDLYNLRGGSCIVSVLNSSGGDVIVNMLNSHGLFHGIADNASVELATLAPGDGLTYQALVLGSNSIDAKLFGHVSYISGNLIQ